MTDVAVLSEGEVERLLEREALALNTAILHNRCGHCPASQLLRRASACTSKAPLLEGGYERSAPHCVC